MDGGNEKLIQNVYRKRARKEPLGRYKFIWEELQAIVNMLK